MDYHSHTTRQRSGQLLLILLLSMLLAACGSSPAAETAYRIRLPGTDAVIYEAAGLIWYGVHPASDPAAAWIVAVDAGGQRLRNRASGRYIALDPQAPMLVAAVNPGPQTVWTLDLAAPTTSISQAGQLLHSDGQQGYVEHGPHVDSSARWLLEPLSSPAATPAAPPTLAPATLVTRVINKGSGMALAVSDTDVLLASWPASDPRTLWQVVDGDASSDARLINVSTGTALFGLPAASKPRVLPAPPEAPGAHWTLAPALNVGYVLLSNPSAGNGLLYAAADQLLLGKASSFSDDAQWLLEPVYADGRSLPTATLPPAPTAAAPVAAAPTITPVPPGLRGASVPWIEYEAEDGETSGELLGPDRTFGTLAAEASGRRAVQLSATGSFVRFTAQADANAIVVRVALPDAPDGGGITATLSLYVDGEFRQQLTLTSHFAWVYGGPALAIDAPAAGGGHRFFDETSALVDPIPAGASVMLRKDASDSAAWYVLDLIDLEQVAPPLEPPAAALALTDCGAVPDDAADDGAALRQCLDQARASGRSLWIPAGTFDFTQPLTDRMGYAVAEVEIRGAGMWYSTLRGPWARFHCVGDRCRFGDFSVRGATTFRDDANPENAFNGGAGRGSLLENVWIEHTKVGWWVGEGATNVTAGLIIRGSRFRNLFADGVNLCNGTSQSVVEQSHFRNTGDDAVAAWSPAREGPVNTGNIVRFNTVQVPWRASCYALYGGRDNRIEDNLCFDVVTYPGILIAQQFGSHPFSGLTVVQRNSLIRAGGMMWNQPQGALKIHAAEGPVDGLTISDVVIESATYAGVQLDGPAALSRITLRDVTIRNSGAAGILISSGANGGAIFDSVTVVAPGTVPLTSAAPPSRFRLDRRGTSTGW